MPLDGAVLMRELSRQPPARATGASRRSIWCVCCSGRNSRRGCDEIPGGRDGTLWRRERLP